MGRKWYEATFYLRPYLHEYVTGMCGKAPYILDAYGTVGLLASACLRQHRTLLNGAFRTDRKPITFRLTRRQRLDYGLYIGNQEMVRFERMVTNLLREQLVQFVLMYMEYHNAEPGKAKPIAGSHWTPDISSMANAVRAFMDAHNISSDFCNDELLQKWVRSHPKYHRAAA